jgi:triosephosphate isomerase
MAKKFIAGNWKLNLPDLSATLELTRRLKARLAPFTETRIAVCPPFTVIPAVAELLKETRIFIGGQNLYWEESGAYTGEISAPMLKSVGCTYVIVGHSERRRYFGETNEGVRRKIQAALKNGLKPIVCVGETLEEREAGVLQDIVREQVEEALREMDEDALGDLVIAYEPVWAIGTGRTATPEQAQEMHRFIREMLMEHFSRNFAETTQILYGGSVKPGNAGELLKQMDIDGALVGGASLDADAFTEIVRSAEQSA